jgi:hypothetical protein
MDVDELLRFQVSYLKLYIAGTLKNPKNVEINFAKPAKPFEAENGRQQERPNSQPKKKLKPSIAANLDLLSDKQKLEILKTLENEPEV